MLILRQNPSLHDLIPGLANIQYSTTTLISLYTFQKGVNLPGGNEDIGRAITARLSAEESVK